jgi:hypothetical protein
MTSPLHLPLPYVVHLVAHGLDERATNFRDFTVRHVCAQVQPERRAWLEVSTALRHAAARGGRRTAVVAEG